MPISEKRNCAPSPHPQTILLVKDRGMGDALMALASVNYLETLGYHVLLGVPCWVAPLFEQTHRYNIIVPLSFNGIFNSLKSLFYLLFKIKRISAIHQLFERGTAAKILKLAAFLKQIPYTSHNHHPQQRSTVLDQGIIKANIQRDLDGIYTFYSKSKQLPNFKDFSPRLFVEKNEVKETPPFWLLGVFAGKTTKQWPINYFKQLSTMLVEPIVILAPDQQQATELRSLNFPPHVKIQYIPLHLLPPYLASAKGYIGNDTGIKHLMVALAKPTFTLFGPEPPLEWHPYDTNLHPYFYREDMPCRYDQGFHYCQLDRCDHLSCLKSITPGEVYSKVNQKMNNI